MEGGLLDPTVLIPVAGAVSKARGGVSVAKSALAAGASVGGAVAVQEAGLHATQQLRTGEESAVAIDSSVLLGTFLGAGAATLLSRAEQKAATDAIDRLRTSDGGPADVGAAAVAASTREGLTVSGRVAGAVADSTSWLNPNLRLNTSPVAASRRIGQQLAENTVFQRLHDQGESLGPAAETLMRTTMNARLAEAKSAHDAIFSGARKAGMAMTRADFEEAVGEAMRRGDVGQNDYVTEAARVWREKLYDPFKQEGIDLGLLPHDVTVSEAPSYFRRLYNQQRLTAQEAEFKATVARYYEQSLATEFAADVERHMARINALRTEAGDLRLSPQDRAALLGRLVVQQQQLYGNAPEMVDRADWLNDARQEMAVARERGDKPAYRAAREKAATLRAEGGEGFAKFQKERANLKTRQRNV
ncbi:MAG: hypothetical protein ACRED3_17595, partial [Bradyrhizobium sp.]